MRLFPTKKDAVLWTVLFLLFGVWWWHVPGFTMISDADLTELFRQHRDTFERLLQMADEDNLNDRIGLTWVHDKQLPPERVEEYRRLMRAAGVQTFAAYTRELKLDRARFGVDAQGTIFAGASKGIAYYTSPQIMTQPSLDKSCLAAEDHDCFAVRHLEGNWYLTRAEN